MEIVTAEVKDGRLLVDQPSQLPEGTIVQLVVAEEIGFLSPQDRVALNLAIDEAADDIEAGRLRPARDVVAELKS